MTESVHSRRPQLEDLPRPPGETSIDIEQTPMEPLDGKFAITTDLKGRYLTAVGGGGRITDVIHTDAGAPRAWETFTLWVDSATHQYRAFQTVSGHFITAVNAGGLTSDAIHSDATRILGWEMFKLVPQSPRPLDFNVFAIQTLRGFFLTAVGGGGHASGETIHTDAVNARGWELYNIFRRADFGSGSTYAVEARGGNILNGHLWPIYGGRVSSDDAVRLGGGPVHEMSWTLLKQADGTYAFQTSSGYVLTANGGGLGRGFRTDTPADQIGNWEKFTIVDNGDFTAYIKTYAGMYVTGVGKNEPVKSVRNQSEATRWRFRVLGL
jgi:hypothetical protein